MRYTAHIRIKYLDNGQERFIRPGGRVPEALVDDGLLRSGSITADDADDPDGPMVTAPKPLGRMNRAELDAVVAQEGVSIEPTMTNAAIVEAIEAHRSGRD